MSDDLSPDERTSMDGVGMSLEAIRALLAEKNNMVVDLDDPILGVVTINNAFLAQMDALLVRHQLALKATMKEATEENIKAVKAEGNKFAANFKEAAIESTIAKVTEHQKMMQAFQSTIEFLIFDLKRFCIFCVGGRLVAFFIMVFLHGYLAR